MGTHGIARSSFVGHDWIERRGWRRLTMDWTEYLLDLASPTQKIKKRFLEIEFSNRYKERGRKFYPKKELDSSSWMAFGLKLGRRSPFILRFWEQSAERAREGESRSERLRVPSPLLKTRAMQMEKIQTFTANGGGKLTHRSPPNSKERGRGGRRRGSKKRKKGGGERGGRRRGFSLADEDG